MNQINLIELITNAFETDIVTGQVRQMDLSTAAQIVNNGCVIPQAAKVIKNSEFTLHTLKSSNIRGNLVTWLSDPDDNLVVVDMRTCEDLDMIQTMDLLIETLPAMDAYIQAVKPSPKKKSFWKFW